MANIAHQCKNKECPELCHKRLRKRNYNSIKETVINNTTQGIKLNNCNHNTVCKTCIQIKISDFPYPKLTSQHKTHKLLNLIRTKVFTLVGKSAIGGKKCFFSFIYDHSRFIVINLLSDKNKIYEQL